jgi:hypothetical protein
MAPWKDIGLSPYETLYGLPYLISVTDVPSFETKDYFLKNYILGLSSTLLCLRKKGLLAQAPPLDFPVHPHQPGDYVLIKTWKESLGWTLPGPADHGDSCPDCRAEIDSSHTGKEGAPPTQPEGTMGCTSHPGNSKVTLKTL